MSFDGIELRHLRFFAALAEERSFSRAAERCNVSQPPFSVAIQQLEAQLGVQLVQGSNRPVELTAAGLAFQERAVRVIAQAHDAYLLAERVARGRKGHLRVGFHASMIYRGLPAVLEQLAQEEPLVDIELIEMASYDQAQALLAGRLDLGFAHSIVAPEPLAALTVHVEPFVACLPETHRCAQQPGLDLAELSAEAFVIFSREASPAYFDRIVSMCIEAGFTPQIHHQVRQWLTVVSMVAKGMGVAIVPRCLADTGIRGCVFRPLTGTSAASTIQCMWLAAHDSPLIMRLVEVTRRLMSPPGLPQTDHPPQEGPV